jgi:TetR/AcrR family transcriptional regulator, transcriptional repressor for nem operon
MRVSKQAAAENRRQILTAAARLFREHGIDGVGVDAITEAAGLTHGTFYSQFESKPAVIGGVYASDRCATPSRLAPAKSIEASAGRGCDRVSPIPAQPPHDLSRR